MNTSIVNAEWNNYCAHKIVEYVAKVLSEACLVYLHQSQTEMSTLKAIFSFIISIKKTFIIYRIQKHELIKTKL